MRTAPSLPLLLLAALACSDSPTDDGSLEACAGQVAVTVGAGTTPSFDWAPRCLVAGVLVEPTQTGQGGDRWSIRADGNVIGPSLAYGVLPPNAQLVRGPEPLSSGGSYRIILWTIAPGSQTTVANHAFAR